VIEGLIFDIKRFAVHDGPGIRTTIFFKGCPLSCWWCHNPESRSDKPQRSVKHLSLDGHLFEEEEIAGYNMRVNEVLREVEKDRIFYEESGGGVTLSGGEPLHQPDFCEELLKSLKTNGFHTAIDTSGYAPAEVIGRMIPFTDLFLYDLKLMDDPGHQKYTGVSNEIILDNLRLLVNTGREVIIRFPVIPAITDNPSNIQSIIEFLGSMQECRNAEMQNLNSPAHQLTMATSLRSSPQASPIEIDLLPFHAISKNKYRRFGMEDKLDSEKKVSTERLMELKALFENAGFRIKIGG